MTEPRHPFEVVGELTMKVGDPQPAFSREPGDQPTGAVRVGAFTVGDWGDATETPLQAIARLDTEVVEKNNELVAMRQQRERAEAEFQLRLRAEAELDRFKERVREKAIEVADRMDWCDPGLNEVLRELGLPEKVLRWKVPIVVTARQTVWITVSADSEEYASRQVDTDDVHRAVDRSDWEIADWEESDFESIEPADDDE